jgi:HlyD family secretion protein
MFKQSLAWLGVVLAALVLNVLAVRMVPGLYGLSAPQAAEAKGAESQQGSPVVELERLPVTALGRLEPATGVIDLGGLTGDRVEKLLVAEGAWVQAGTELARLGSYGLREMELKLAETQLSEARHRLEIEQKYAAALEREAVLAEEQNALLDRDLAAQQQQLAFLEQSLERAAQEHAAMTQLGESVTAYELSQHELAVRKLESEVQAARELLDKLRASRELADRLAAAKRATAEIGEARVSATLQLGSLQQAVEAARLRLEQAVVKAPADGRILRILVREGETLTTRPIFRFGDDRRMHIVAEVYEDDVHRIQTGDAATATARAIPDQTLRGTVIHVGRMIARNEAVSLDPTARADLRVVEARIELDEASSAVAARFVHLQVEVQIKPRPERAGRAATPDP